MRREIDDHEIIALSDLREKHVQRRHRQCDRFVTVAGRCKNIDAAGMAADEQVEKMCIEALGIGDDLLHLHARFEIEVIADMARLHVEVEQTDAPTSRRLIELELHGGFECERGVADAAAARNESSDL